MLMIRPVAINEDVLVETNVAEVTPEIWKAGTTYDEGDLVFAPTYLTDELVANGDFSGGSTSWTAGGSTVIGAGFATATAQSGSIVTQNSILSVGRRYRVSFDYTMDAGYGFSVHDEITDIATSLVGTTGTITFDFVATSANFYINAGYSAFTGTIDNISVRAMETIDSRHEVYRSLVDSNLGNDPVSSPSEWVSAGFLPAYYLPTLNYVAGDIVVGRVFNTILDSKFDQDLDGWTDNSTGGTASVVWAPGGVARLSATTAGHKAQLQKSAPLVAGRRYRATVHVSGKIGTSNYWIFGTAYHPNMLFSTNEVGVFTAEFTALSSSDTLYLVSNDGAGSLAVTDFSRVIIEEATTDMRMYESMSGSQNMPALITIASPGVVTFASHGAVADTPVVFETTGALPTGLAAGTTYYVKSPTTNTFTLAASPGGAAINTSGTQSGSHTAILDPNKNNEPSTDDGSNWLDLGPTNPWAMFDNVAGTTTTDPFLIDVTLEPGGRVDSLALMGLENAVTVQVIMTADPEGEVYNETFDMTSTEGIFDWYSYFTEEIDRQTSLLITDLPGLYADPSIRIIITGTATADVAIGHLALGRFFDLGRTLHDGAQVGITDYSRKEADEYGNYAIVERAFAKRGSFQTFITSDQVDGVQSVLADYRAIPSVYSASGDYAATLIFGFYRDFYIEIAYPTESLVSIEIEGLV